MASSGNFNTNGYEGRYLTFNWSIASQSIENNTTTINWSLVGAGDALSGYYYSGNFKVIINGQQVYYSPDRIQLWKGTVVASGTYTMNHDSAGNKTFSASAEAGIYAYAVNCSGSGSWTLTQIPRASKINEIYTDNNDIEKGIAVYYTSYYSGYTNKLRISIPQVTVLETIDNYKSEKWFELSDATINYLYSYMTNSNTVELGAVIETWNGSTKIGESKELLKTFYLRDANPTFGSTSYKDNNGTTVAITGNNQRIIRNNSDLLFTFGTATAKKGATISKYQVTIAGETKERTSAGDINFGKVNLSSNTTATLKVIDSRGNSASKNITVTIDDWVLPTGLISLNRKNNFYSETYIKVDGSCSSLNGKNVMTITCQYKKVSDSNYTSVSLSDNIQKTLDLDNNYKWNISVIVADKIGRTTYNLILDRGMPIIFFDRLLSSVGVNCFPKKEKSIEVDGDAEANNLSRAKNIDDLINFEQVGEGQQLYKSGLYSVCFKDNNTWYNLINIRHRNGKDDGTKYGLQLRQQMTADKKKLQIRQQNAGTWGEWRNIQEEPTVLYDGVDAGGTLETITLSESATNFSYIEIFATKDTSSGIWSVKTPSPQGRTVQIGTSYYAGSAYQTIGKTVKIQDNKITHNEEFYINFNKTTGAIANLGGQNTVKILKVIGYR